MTVLLQLFYDSEGTKLVSDSEMRYPAHVDDIASICVDLLELKETNADVKGIPLPPYVQAVIGINILFLHRNLSLGW